MLKVRISNQEILALEELSLNSWPALRSINYDGWIIRMADGFTKRCNSVWPLYGSNLSPEEKIEKCESFYEARNQPVIFRIPSDESRASLDDLLNTRGYERVTPTIVQTLDLTALKLPPNSSKVAVTNTLTEEWPDNVAELIGIGEHKSTFHKILQKIVWPVGFASARIDGVPAALGMCVAEKPYLGIYGMYTHPSYRKQGWARRLLDGMLSWGRDCGAENAYLHVEADNTPGRSLYEKYGFTAVYSYWYRVFRQR